MALDRLPESLVVIGGSYVGLELSQLFADLGTKVTIVEARDRLAPQEEPEVSAWITRVLTDQGVDVVTSATVTAVRGEGRKKVVVERGDGEQVIEAKEILVAIGRRPALHGLGLDAAGIELDRHGGLVLDD